MPSRSWLNRIRDILNAIDEIQGFTDGMTIEDFQADPRTVKAVLYNMAIIGEAARNLPSDVEELYPEIPWVDVRGIRNVVIHKENRREAPFPRGRGILRIFSGESRDNLANYPRRPCSLGFLFEQVVGIILIAFFLCDSFRD